MRNLTLAILLAMFHLSAMAEDTINSTQVIPKQAKEKPVISNQFIKKPVKENQ